MNTEEKDLPEEVCSVRDAFTKVCKERDEEEGDDDDFFESLVYASKDGDEWRVGVDAERLVPFLLVMRDDKWYFRTMYDGEDKEITHGAAISNAEVTFG